MEYVEIISYYSYQHGVFLWVLEATKGRIHLFLTIFESLYFRALLSLTIDHLYRQYVNRQQNE